MIRPLWLYRRRLIPFGWGFVDQGLSSAISFAFSILAARLLGPEGLGLIGIGFSAYILLTGVQRAFLTDPLVSTTSARDSDLRAKSSGVTLIMVIAFGATTSVLLFIVGQLTEGPLATSFVLFSPWILPLLIQDFSRVLLFRDGRSRDAAMSEMVWATTMLLVLVTSWRIRAEWVLVSAWGLGACGALAFASRRIHVTRVAPLAAFHVWRNEQAPLGGWLAAETVIFHLGIHGTVFALAGILGTEMLGGIRAVQAVFAPLSLIGPAIAMPGFPAVVRTFAVSPRRAKAMALRLGAAAAIIVAIYTIILAFDRASVIRFIFGSSFIQFINLIWPVVVGQLLAAASLGLPMILKAQQRGYALLQSRLLGSGGSFLFSVWLGYEFGALGAAWGFVVGSALGTLLLTAQAFGASGIQEQEEVSHQAATDAPRD